MLDHDPQDAEPSQIQEGTVGWPGSPEITELGSEAGDGIALVRVTLRHGAPTGKPTSDDGGCNGLQIQARVMGPPWRIPKRGARVLVVFPGGDWETPGGAVILGEIGASPSSRFGRKKTVLDYGDDDVVITGKTVMLLVDQKDAGGKDHRHILSVSQQGGVQLVSDGSGLFVQDGEINLKTLDGSGNLREVLKLSQSEASLSDYSNATAFASLTLSDGKISGLGNFITWNYFQSGSFGKYALTSPATPIVVGLTGTTGIGCASLFGSPT
jgi:hypothetical protein